MLTALYAGTEDAIAEIRMKATPADTNVAGSVGSMPTRIEDMNWVSPIDAATPIANPSAHKTNPC
jgi:hypothetical protein